jgi:hypothetical protein
MTLTRRRRLFYSNSISLQSNAMIGVLMNKDSQHSKKLLSYRKTDTTILGHFVPSL